MNYIPYRGMSKSNPSLRRVRIPPPVIALICALFMWAVFKLTPELNFAFTGQKIIAGLVTALGLSLDVISVKGFWTARTTINPIKLEKTSALVTSGLYRMSRNPMYLGMALVLSGWAIWLGNPLNVIGLAIFIGMMNVLQIKPEEAALTEKFGQAYLDYQRRVRRWI